MHRAAAAAPLLLLCSVTSWAADGGYVTSYVQTPVVSVRAAPDEAAAEIARLRFNAQVKSAAASESWREVRLSSTANGFVPSGALAGSKTSASSLREKAKKAAGTERIPLLEKLVVLEPDRAEHYTQLAAHYRDGGYEERAVVVERAVKADAPADLLACVAMPGDRPRLGAVLLGATVREKRAQEIAKEPSAPELRAGIELAGAAWMKLAPNGPKAVSGAPFSMPLGFHPLPQAVDPAYGLEMGRCEKEGDLYVVAPARAATPTKDDLAKLAAKKLLPEAKTKILWFRAGLGDSPLRGVFPYSLGVHHESGTAFSGYRMLVLPASGDPLEIDFEIYSVGGG